MTSYAIRIIDGPSREQLFDTCKLGMEYSGMICEFEYALYDQQTGTEIGNGAILGHVISLRRGHTPYHWEVEVYIVSAAAKTYPLIDEFLQGHTVFLYYYTVQHDGVVKQKK